MFRAKSWMPRAHVAVLLLVSLCAGPVTLPHAEDSDDFACSLVLVSHDESAHYIGAAPTASDVDGRHCFLCHSLRSFYPGLDKFVQHDGALRTEQPHTAPFAFAGHLDWSLVSGRAPPA
jgi:hypothetical protein